MNTKIVSIDAITIEELSEKKPTPLSGEPEDLLPEVVLPVNRRFGIVDLWNIRRRKKHTSIYR